MDSKLHAKIKTVDFVRELRIKLNDVERFLEKGLTEDPPRRQMENYALEQVLKQLKKLKNSLNTFNLTSSEALIFQQAFKRVNDLYSHWLFELSQETGSDLNAQLEERFLKQSSDDMLIRPDAWSENSSQVELEEPDTCDDVSDALDSSEE